MKRYSIVSTHLFLILCCLSLISLAEAEGDRSGQGVWAQAFGANRVVRTNEGFIGVTGTFTVPRFFIPVVSFGNNPSRPRIANDLYDGTRSAGTPAFNAPYNLDSIAEYLTDLQGVNLITGTTGRAVAPLLSNLSNPQNSKPTFYLGSQSNIPGGTRQVDAGLHYEWVPLGTATPGWALFISHNEDFYNYRVGGITPYRSGWGSRNPVVASYTLTHDIVGGRANLDWDVTGSDHPDSTPYFSWRHPANASNTQVYPQAERNGVRMKRVIGITQRRNARGVLDGSFLRNGLFNGGQLRLRSENAYDAWVTGDVWQNQTGYAPGGMDRGGGTNEPVADRGAKFRVDFPGITATARASNPAITTNAIRTQWHDTTRVTTRYTREFVEINLRRGAGVRGVQVFRRSRPVN